MLLEQWDSKHDELILVQKMETTERPEDEEEEAKEEFTWHLSDWENWLESSSGGDSDTSTVLPA